MMPMVAMSVDLLLHCLFDQEFCLSRSPGGPSWNKSGIKQFSPPHCSICYSGPPSPLLIIQIGLSPSCFIESKVKFFTLIKNMLAMHETLK
ncbi:hypothetical protein Y1Q_0017987 [Alligator mississippiensis]|uniref:Secreted protein n=1 Tax=Alligator mississippiensis TaxID=8496 RepID=A0A151MXW7_ALLMI|nr:hypothetical protein Y1Q_0017987 [Alligator mississippiensis]